MKISSLALEAFFAVSKTLHFSQAAKALAITQSALSQRILNLEEYLGTPLFIRDPAGVRLTENGQVLLRFCQTQAALEEEVLSKLSPQKKLSSSLAGTIRIGGYSSVMRSLILPRLHQLIVDNPEVRFEVFVRELNELPDLLRRGEADFVVVDQVLDHSDLVPAYLGQEENVLIESKRIKTRALTYLDHDPTDRTTERYFKIQKKPFPKNARRSYLDDIYGILDGVKNGWGRAVVPRHLIEGRADLSILPDQVPLKNPIYLHYYRQPYYSALFSRTLASLEDRKSDKAAGLSASR